jgi:hypothetical protein
MDAMTRESKISIGLALMLVAGAYWHFQQFEKLNQRIENLTVRAESIAQLQADVRELRTMHYQHSERVMQQLAEIRMEAQVGRQGGRE